jgi:hypothetical protein
MGSGEMPSTDDIYIADGSLELPFGMLSGVPELMASYCQTFVTAITHTPSGCKNWKLA